jgi:hypothetical protein
MYKKKNFHFLWSQQEVFHIYVNTKDPKQLERKVSTKTKANEEKKQSQTAIPLKKGYFANKAELRDWTHLSNLVRPAPAHG